LFFIVVVAKWKKKNEEKEIFNGLSESILPAKKSRMVSERATLPPI